MVERGKLHTYHTAAHNEHRLRQGDCRQRIGRIPHGGIVLHAGNRRHEVRRTRANQQIIRRILLLAAGNHHLFIGTTHHACRPADHRAVLVVEALLDTRHEFAHHLGLALRHFGVVEDNILCRNAVLRSILGVIVLLGTVEQGLGRNAPHIEASATESSLLKQHHILSGLRRLLRCGVPRRPSPDNR